VSNPGVSAQRQKFPRRFRLLRHSDFERVYKSGRRHFAPHLTVFYLQRVKGDGMRLGFTVGRVLGGAVERNRIKRRLREAVRMHRPQDPPAFDVVVNPKKSALRTEFSELCSEISRAFEVIGNASTKGERKY
jgi:ribonuclease P protein component